MRGIDRARIYDLGYPPTVSEQAKVIKISGMAEALTMHPAVMATAARVYGEGGWPLRRAGAVWAIHTPLCAGYIVPTGRAAARLTLWLRKADAPRESWPEFCDFVGGFEIRGATKQSMIARRLNCHEAAEAAGLPLLVVERWIRDALGTGRAPEPGDRFNGIALRQLLAVRCAEQAKAHAGKEREYWQNAGDTLHAISNLRGWCEG